MKRFLLATVIAVAPICEARAQWAVIDISSIIEEMRIEWQALQSYVTQVQQYVQEVQTAVNMATMVANVVTNPSISAVLAVAGMAGLNLDLPVSPYAVQGLLSGWGGSQSLSSLTGRLSMLGSAVNTSYGANRLYACTDDSFACQQSTQNAWSAAGHLGVLSRLYEGVVDHNPVLQELRTSANSPSPATREGTIAQATVENAWHTGQLIQVEAVNGMAQAQARINAQQADEKMRSDFDSYKAAVP